MAAAEDRETPDVTAELAGSFALIFLAMETLGGRFLDNLVCENMRTTFGRPGQTVDKIQFEFQVLRIARAAVRASATLLTKYAHLNYPVSWTTRDCRSGGLRRELETSTVHNSDSTWPTANISDYVVHPRKKVQEPTVFDLQITFFSCVFPVASNQTNRNL